MLLNYRQWIDLLHLVIVAPLLWTLATNKFPEEYKQYLLWFIGILVVYYLYRLFVDANVEGMQTISGSNIHNIKIFDSFPGYDQQNLTIKVGDSVVWTNVGEVEHTVTEINGDFNSGSLKPGQTFSVQFNKPGIFRYQCMFHSGWMHGIISVV